jgi:hypothetical protein
METSQTMNTRAILHPDMAAAPAISAFDSLFEDADDPSSEGAEAGAPLAWASDAQHNGRAANGETTASGQLATIVDAAKRAEA